jgi:hypothetical protein
MADGRRRREENREDRTASGGFVPAERRCDVAGSVVVPTDPVAGSRLQGPVSTDYGLREFALVDPSGSLLRVGSPPVG